VFSHESVKEEHFLRYKEFLSIFIHMVLDMVPAIMLQMAHLAAVL
jgi:hypothetical protein